LLADLITCLCIIHKEGQSYYFVHNIFQEFYAANYLYDLDNEVQEQFFKDNFLAEDMNSRLIDTTSEYYHELDKEFNKKKLKYNIFLPVLEEFKSRNEGRDFVELDTISYRVILSTKGEGDDIFCNFDSVFLSYFTVFAEMHYFSVQDKNLPLPVKFPKIKECWISASYGANLTTTEYYRLRFKMNNEIQNVKLKREVMEFMERYKLDSLVLILDSKAICKDATWYEVFKNSSAYERLKAIDDWVIKTRLEKEADKRKIPILNFKK